MRMFLTRLVLSFVAVCALALNANAQVTTGSLNGKVQNATQEGVSGASVIAIHLPSGTTYETTSRADGRFIILNMRVGGPYSVTVAYTGTGTAAFAPETVENVEINLGVATDLNFDVKPIAVTETVTVTAESSAVFSSARTGAATSVNRETLATLPTVSGRISDFTRLTPQTSGANSFGGADNRMNNMTVNGAAFNNSFGLGGQPGERTGVAPISMEAIEQVQVSIAPYDVRQGNFVGASVDTVTRSGTNSLRASAYYRFRNDGFVGTEARGNVFNPGTFDTKQTGGWAGAPIVKNRLFVFGNFENEKDARPLYSFRANNGGEPVGGNVTRVLASDATNLSAFLKSSFGYDTGSFDPATDNTPQKRGIFRTDFNLNHEQQDLLQLRSAELELGQPAVDLDLGRHRPPPGRRPTRINYQGSNYQILENRKTAAGEWNTVLGSTMSNTLRVTYSSSDESRPQSDVLFPFVDILQGGTAYLSFGSEPFTPNNELRYKSFEVKNDFTKFGRTHEFTFGGRIERYHSDNVFFNCCKQGAWVYNSLDDFYADARDALANPNRTTSPVTIRKYQNRYMNLPGLDKPEQPLTALYGGAYAQDVWRPKSNLSVTLGLRFDVPVFENTAYLNPNANALTFRDEDGQPVQYDSGQMPGANILWSPRLGFNYDVAGDQKTQLRGGTGVFTGQPLYVWISNQLGNTGMLQGSLSADTASNQTHQPVPVLDQCRPLQAGGDRTARRQLRAERHRQRLPLPAGVAQQHRRRPPPARRHHRHRGIHLQPRRQRHLLHQCQPAGGADDLYRRRQPPALDAPRQPHQQRDRQPGDQRDRDEEPGHRPQLEPRVLGLEADVARAQPAHRLQLRRGEEHDRSGLNGVQRSWSQQRHRPAIPTTRASAIRQSSPGHRYFLSATYTKQYFEWAQHLDLDVLGNAHAGQHQLHLRG